MEIGVYNNDEVQRILVQGSPKSGSFTVNYKGLEAVAVYNHNPGLWATNLQSALRSMRDAEGNYVLQDVTVTGQPSTKAVVFDITFTGHEGQRSYTNLTVTDNSLVPACAIAFNRMYAGSPINTTAPAISATDVPPNSINFFVPSQQSPITLPWLAVNDGFPLWIRRTVNPNTDPMEEDQFSLRVTAEVSL